MEQKEDRPDPEHARMSTGQTVVGLVSGIIGAGVLGIPMLVKESGLINFLLVLAGCCLGQYLICYLVYVVMEPHETDQGESVARIAQNEFESTLFTVSLVLSALSNLALYFSLVCDMVYNILASYLVLPPKAEFVLDQFSLQYLAIIAVVVVFCLMSVSSIHEAFLLSQLGTVGIFLFVLLIVYMLFFAPLQLDLSPQPVRLFGPVDSMLLLLTLACSNQAYFVTVLKLNADQASNWRALAYSYVLTFLCYSLVGCTGYFLIKDVAQKRRRQTVLDYLTQEQPVLCVAVQLIYIMHILTTFPSHMKVVRLRLAAIGHFSLLRTNLLAALAFFLVVFFRKFLPILLVIELNGSIFSLPICYYFPAAIYLRHQRALGCLPLWKEVLLWLLIVFGFAITIFSLVTTLVRSHDR